MSRPRLAPTSLPDLSAPEPLPPKWSHPVSVRIDDAAEATGICVRQLRTHIAAGRIPHCRDGRSLLILWDDLDGFVRSLRQETAR